MTGFSIVPDLPEFYSGVCHIKEISKRNKFPVKLIDSYIKNLLNKGFTEKPVTLTAEKKDLVIALPFFGKLLLDLRTRVENTIQKTFPFVKLELFLNLQHAFAILSSSKMLAL